ncbi:MAG: long-chain acyl-CoA synthetase [Alteromonadaceae bacterium]|jgi:long-chain acyl-CoA synthetase
MLFTLADLFNKVISKRWQGQLHFYPSDTSFDAQWVKVFSEQLAVKVDIHFGDRVLVTDEVTPQTVATLLWLWDHGAVVVPVRHSMGKEALKRIADDCHARVCIRQGEVTELEGYQQLAMKFQCNTPRRVCGSDLALLIYTSGSTGKPKGIMLSHTNVITAMYSIANYLQLDQHEHILCLSPLSFDYGLYQLLFGFAFDCDLTLFELDFHPIKVVKAIEAQQISLLPVVPAMASALSKIIQVFKKPLPSLTKLTNTGGHLGEETITLMTNLLPQLQVFAMYGLTECKRALYLPPEESLSRLGSVGIPIPGLEAKVFIEVRDGEQKHYKEVPRGDIGELFIRGSTLMQGYYGSADAGASILNGNYRDDNWLATGDLFCQNEEGYFYFKGRSKDLIKQAGFCLYPAELEALIETHHLVHLVAIVPHADKSGDEIACLYVQLLEQDEAHQTEFKQWLSEALDASYRPREVRFTDKMVLTPNSKVDKQRLILNL